MNDRWGWVWLVVLMLIAIVFFLLGYLILT
jgi:hypothetical protein